MDDDLVVGAGAHQRPPQRGCVADLAGGGICLVGANQTLSLIATGMNQRDYLLGSVYNRAWHSESQPTSALAS